MHLLLDNAGGVSTRPFPANESNRGGASGSAFSQLLAGKLIGSSNDEYEIGNRTGQGDSASEKADSDSEVPAKDRADNNPDPTQTTGSGKQVSDDGIPPMTAGDGIIAGELVGQGGLAGLLFTTQTTGMGNITTPGFGMSEGIPADFRSRLAGDIAAGFSNRNGVQTLVLKLDSDHLGQVDVRMQAKDDHLSVRILAADRESEAALRGNIKELSEAILKRTGRFQHVEVRVELKGGEDQGRQAGEEDPEHNSGRNDHGGKSGDPETKRDPANQDAEEVETGPDNRAQGG